MIHDINRESLAEKAEVALARAEERAEDSAAAQLSAHGKQAFHTTSYFSLQIFNADNTLHDFRRADEFKHQGSVCRYFKAHFLGCGCVFFEAVT